jgi:hypothetical protein
LHIEHEGKENDSKNHQACVIRFGATHYSSADIDSYKQHHRDREGQACGFRVNLLGKGTFGDSGRDRCVLEARSS